MPAIQTDGGQILYRLFISYIRGPILFAMLYTSGFYLVL